MGVIESERYKALNVEDYVNLPFIEADQRLFYGTDEEQFGDLYLPEQDGPHPLVILLHGGCWQAQYGLAQLGLCCRVLKDMGIAVWNLEYRRLGNGGGWPVTFLDVAAGTDYLRQIAESFDLDLSRLVVAGHSAGGHLALWLASRPHLPTESLLYSAHPLPIKGIVSLAGIPDLAQAVRQNICRGAPQALIGGLPSQLPTPYAHASPSQQLPLGIPQRLINGMDDLIVPVDYVKEYAKKAKAQGEDVKLEILPQTGHFELVIPNTAAWAKVKEAILELLAI